MRQQREKQEHARAQKKETQSCSKAVTKRAAARLQTNVRNRCGNRVQANAKRFLADACAQYRRKEQIAQQTVVRDLCRQLANKNKNIIRFGFRRLFTYRRGATQSLASAFVNGPHMSADFHNDCLKVPGQQVDAR